MYNWATWWETVINNNGWEKTGEGATSSMIAQFPLTRFHPLLKAKWYLCTAMILWQRESSCTCDVFAVPCNCRLHCSCYALPLHFIVAFSPKLLMMPVVDISAWHQMGQPSLQTESIKGVFLLTKHTKPWQYSYLQEKGKPNDSLFWSAQLGIQDGVTLWRAMVFW